MTTMSGASDWQRCVALFYCAIHTFKKWSLTQIFILVRNHSIWNSLWQPLGVRVVDTFWVWYFIFYGETLVYFLEMSITGVLIEFVSIWDPLWMLWLLIGRDILILLFKILWMVLGMANDCLGQSEIQNDSPGVGFVEVETLLLFRLLEAWSYRPWWKL